MSSDCHHEHFFDGIKWTFTEGERRRSWIVSPAKSKREKLIRFFNRWICRNSFQNYVGINNSPRAFNLFNVFFSLLWQTPLITLKLINLIRRLNNWLHDDANMRIFLCHQFGNRKNKPQHNIWLETGQLCCRSIQCSKAVEAHFC